MCGSFALCGSPFVFVCFALLRTFRFATLHFMSLACYTALHYGTPTGAALWQRMCRYARTDPHTTRLPLKQAVHWHFAPTPDERHRQFQPFALVECPY